jgi:pimeloyl-ACP methyl ester carboxylesterase
MADEPRLETFPIHGGRIETIRIGGGPGRPLLVIGGIETGLRKLAGTEAVLKRRWAGRSERRSVVVAGRPLPDDPADAERMLHPRVVADTLAGVLAPDEAPYDIEAESAGGRIALWLAADHPELVWRMALASVASETPPGSPMADRMRQSIGLAEEERRGEFFGRMAVQMRPASAADGADSFQVATRLQPRPATPERFIAELRATVDPSSFVTDRLREIGAPTLVLAGGRDQIVPSPMSEAVAGAIPGARFELDPSCGHTVRADFDGYDRLVESFLAEGD